MKRFVYFFICAIFFLTGCQKTGQEYTSATDYPEKESMFFSVSSTENDDSMVLSEDYNASGDLLVLSSKRYIDGAFCMVGDEIICLDYDPFDKIVFSSVNPVTKESRKIGSTADTFIACGDPVVVDDVFYFYLTKQRTEQGFENILYKVDTVNYTVETLSAEMTYQTQVITKKQRENLVTLKGFLDDNINVQRVDWVDGISYERKTLFESKYNMEKGTGEVIYGIDYADFYYMLLRKQTDGKPMFSLNVYNDDFQLLQSFDFTQFMEEMGPSPIKNFIAFQNYIFIECMNQNSVLCKMDETKLVPVVSGNYRSVVHVSRSGNGVPYFITQNKLLTVMDHTLYLYEMDYQDASIVDLLTSDEKLLLFLRNNRNESIQIFGEMSKILSNPISNPDEKYNLRVNWLHLE